MPRRPRIESVGFHHIINRGVARGEIFLKEDDYRAFLDILQVSKSRYNFTVHSLCLMPNHYHLLIETTHENLSMLARQINSKYAQYFNREYKRVGPLWQGRFKNWYVYDDKYLHNLIRYIEQNPIKAKMVNEIGEYPWSSSTFILNTVHGELLERSQLFDMLKSDLLSKELNHFELEEIDTFHKTVYKSIENRAVRQKQSSLEEHFEKFKTLSQRNSRILEAFNDGYKQSEIARYLKMTAANVSKILAAPSMLSQ